MPETRQRRHQYKGPKVGTSFQSFRDRKKANVSSETQRGGKRRCQRGKQTR